VAEDPNVHPVWAAETKHIAACLDQLDYFQVLGASIDMPFEELKVRYHQLQRNYHPDAFFTSPDPDLKDAVRRIAKRVAEAYVILKDSEKRAKYTRDIQGPERPKKLRYNDEMQREQRIEKEQEQGKTAQGRQLWKKADDSAKKGDIASAIRDLKTGMLFEKENERFKARIAELEAQLKK
jgi:curved DNA-binding protein CbpA